MGTGNREILRVAKENDKMIMEMYGLGYDEFFPPSHSDEE